MSATGAVCSRVSIHAYLVRPLHIIELSCSTRLQKNGCGGLGVQDSCPDFRSSRSAIGTIITEETLWLEPLDELVSCNDAAGEEGEIFK